MVSGDEAPGLKLWRAWSINSLPLLPESLGLKEVEPVRVPSMGWIDFEYKQMIIIKLELLLESIKIYLNYK